jgi:hypothetical protein
MKDSLKHLYIKKTGLILCLVVIGLFMVWARSFYGSMKAYNQGEIHLKKQQYVGAITFFDRSLHWYTPHNPYIQKSAERLWEIAMRAEQQGNLRLALIATRTIRRGFYAARSLYTPGKNWIKQCDLKINELMRLEQGKKETQNVPSQLDQLIRRRQKATSPSTLWSIIVEIGFGGWVGSVIGFIMFACKGDRKVRLLPSQGVVWASLALIFFALWLVGMMKA